MNVFVLSTGRCGSTTFIKACEHIKNYSAGHETRLRMVGEPRLQYPEDHIEADNRLTWFLGRLELAYGDDAFYVHLTRDKASTIDSFTKRAHMGIMKTWAEGVYLNKDNIDAGLLARDYVESATANIELFLGNKSHTMHFRLENAKQDFIRFWELIQAEGNMEQALAEWNIHYNNSA